MDKYYLQISHYFLLLSPHWIEELSYFEVLLHMETDGCRFRCTIFSFHFFKALFLNLHSTLKDFVL